MTKLKIGIDIDGVIVDIVAAMLPLLSSACEHQVYHKDIYCFDIGKALNIEGEMKRIWASVYTDGLLRTASAIKGAVDGLDKLSHHEIWLVTHRPLSTQGDTELWLATKKIRYDKLEFVTNSKKLSLGIDFNVFIEDNLDQACYIAHSGISSILFDQPWNQCDHLPTHCVRVDDWGVIVRFINTFGKQSSKLIH